MHDRNECLWPVDVSLFSEYGREEKKTKVLNKLSLASVWLVFNGCGENYLSDLSCLVPNVMEE